MAVIINSDTKTAGIYKFEAFHDRARRVARLPRFALDNLVVLNQVNREVVPAANPTPAPAPQTFPYTPPYS
jgi:hypothetical protein